MRKYLWILLFLAIKTPLFAQTEIADSILIDEVVVTTQRIPRIQLLVPYSINLINSSEARHFEKRTLPEMLMNTGGVFMQKTNHGGGSPFIRGLTGNQTLLLIDGIRMNNSIYRYGPNQYLNTVDVFSINRVEVARGTGAVQYGSDALGGAIQLFSNSPELSATPFLHGEITGKAVTSGMEKTGHARIETGSNRVAFLAEGTYRDFGDLIGGKKLGVQSPSGYTEYAYDAKMLAKLQKNMTLTLASQMLKQIHVPIYHKIVLEDYAENEFHPQQRWLNYARLDIAGVNKIFNDVHFIASWQQNTENTIIRKNDSIITQFDDNKVNTVGFVTDVTSRFSQRWSANSGIEYYVDKVSSSRLLLSAANVPTSLLERGLYPNDSKYESFSLFSLHHFSLGKWEIDGGARWSTFSIKISDKDLGDVKIKPSALVFNFGAMYQLNTQNHVYANVSNGFRAPNINDMGTLGIVDFRYEVPAYDLKPEKSVNFETGYKFGASVFQGGVTAYYMRLNNLITRVKTEGEMIDGYPVYKKENIEKAYITGGEASFSWKPLRTISLNGNVAYTYGQSITKNEPLRRIPPFFGKLTALYAKHSYFFSGELIFAGKQDRLSSGDVSDNRIPDGGTPGWSVFNLYAGYDFSFMKIKTGFENLFNENYRTHGSGINGVGRSAWLSLSFCF